MLQDLKTFWLANLVNLSNNTSGRRRNRDRTVFSFMSTERGDDGEPTWSRGALSVVAVADVRGAPRAGALTAARQQPPGQSARVVVVCLRCSQLLKRLRSEQNFFSVCVVSSSKEVSPVRKAPLQKKKKTTNKTKQNMRTEKFSTP